MRKGGHITDSYCFGSGLQFLIPLKGRLDWLVPWFIFEDGSY